MVSPCQHTGAVCLSKPFTAKPSLMIQSLEYLLFKSCSTNCLKDLEGLYSDLPLALVVPESGPYHRSRPVKLSYTPDILLLAQTHTFSLLHMPFSLMTQVLCDETHHACCMFV